MNLDFRQISSKLSPRGWMAVGGATIVGVLFIYVLMSLASAPSYTTVLAGVNPAQTGKITSALSTAGIAYQLQNGGTAVAVETGEQSKARVALASGGLLSGTGSSSTLSMNNSSLGESNFEQEVGYQSALEKQLDSAIDQFSGVNSAQTQLNIPDASTELFASTAAQSSASVLLNVDQTPSASMVKAMARMVSDSVPSLSVQKVTVTDQNGDLLWPTAAGAAAGSGSLLASQQAEQTYDQNEAAQVDAMLDSTLGVGKAQVQINAQLNTNQTTEDSVTYGQKGTPLTSTTSNETLSGASTTASGATGTSQTQIAAYGATGKGSGSNYTNTTSAAQYGVSKTIAHTVVTPGQLTHQSVSVLVSSTVPASEIASIQSAVQNATGFNAKRGDTISIGRVSFAKAPAAVTATSSPTKMLGDVKYVAVGLGALLFLFFTTRALRRRESAGIGANPTWLRELETPRSLAEIEGDAYEEPTRVAALRSPVNLAKRQVEDLVDRDPDRVASQLRMWMNED